jgi:hypothetical protein
VQHYSLPQWKTAANTDLNSKITPIQIPNYKVNDLIGDNRIANGTFDSNVNGASYWSPQSNCIITWDNAGGLNGGSLKYSFSSDSGVKNPSLLLFKIGAVVSGKNYIVKFSLKGTKNNTNIGVNLRKRSSPYTNLTPYQYTNITADNKEYEILFNPVISENDSYLQFEIKEADGPLWFDTITLYEADVTLINPDDCIRLEYNATQNDITIPLTEDYIDVKNNLYSESVTLKPFTSILLLKKSPLPIPQNKATLNLNNNDVNNKILLYPNPFNNSFLIKSKKLIKEVVVYNISGKIMVTLHPHSNLVEVKVPQLPQGIYFITTNIDGNWLTSKLIKQ